MAQLEGANAKGAMLALGAYGVFATHDVFVKALGAVYSPFQIIFFSVLFSFPLVTFMLMQDPTSGNLRPRHPWWILLRTAAGVVTGASAFYAFSVLPLAQVYAILFAAPLIITLLSIPVLGERVGKFRAGAVVVGLLGVMVVLRPGATEFSLGHLAALTAAICGATASVVVRKIGRDERDAVLMLYPMTANFLVMSALLPTVYKPMPFVHLGMLGIISVLGFSAGLLVIAAYKTGEAAIVAPMQYSQILWAAAYGLAFFDETPDGFTILGAAIVIASGVFIVLREARVSKTRPVLQSRPRSYNATGPRLPMRGLPGRAHLPLAKTDPSS